MTPTSDGAAAVPPPEAVGPLVRGLRVLRALTAAGGTRALSDLARDTALARSTVDRVVATLERVGHVRLDGRLVTTAPRLMELGNAYLASTGLAALNALADGLAEELDESVSVAVPDADGVRFTHQTTRRRAMSLTFRIGDLLPAERGAPGALFAGAWQSADWRHWEERRQADPEDRSFPAVPPGGEEADAAFARRVAEAGHRGWAVDDQLIEPGLVALAVPVRDPRGRTVCAVSVVSHTRRHTADSLTRTALAPLRRTATAMEAALHSPRPEPRAAQAGAWSRAAKAELGPAFLESLARGLAVLTALGDGTAGLTLSAVAERTGLARATARRSLITLEHLGYVAGEGGRFRLTPRVLELGFARLSGLTLAEVAQPHLVALVERVRESASVSVLDGDQIQYVARVPTVRIMSVNITVGTRFPAHATSMGRALLAALPPNARHRHLPASGLPALTPHTITDEDELRRVLQVTARRGHALVENELEEGLRSLAVALRDADGRPLAAVNVSTHAGPGDAAESEAALLPALRETAAAIEADLRVVGRFTHLATS